MSEKHCPLCGGTGTVPQHPQPAHAEVVRKAVSLVTLALDHAIRGDSEVLTEPELLAVLGDAPLPELIPHLAAVADITAYVVRNTAGSDEEAREWWGRIARHLLEGEDAT